MGGIRCGESRLRLRTAAKPQAAPSIDQPLRDVRIRVNAAVAQEGPIAAHLLHAAAAALDDEHLLAVVRRARQHLPERVADERRPPELQPAARVALVADAV